MAGVKKKAARKKAGRKQPDKNAIVTGKESADPLEPDATLNAPDPEVVEPLPDAIVRNPKIALFVAQLALCSGNMAEASRQCGFEESYGRQLIKRYPELREQTARAIANSAGSEVLEWRHMHQQARETIQKIMGMTFIEPRAALEAAKMVVERVEGKVPKVIVTEDTTSPESVLVRFVAALHLNKGMEVARAFEYALANPDQVNEWGQLHGLVKNKSQALAAIE